MRLEGITLAHHLIWLLLGMQATMREFEDWIEDPVPEPVKIAYDKALAKLEECLPYEDTLVRLACKLHVVVIHVIRLGFSQPFLILPRVSI